MAVFQRTELDNSLRVLTAPLPHAQSVACFVMLAAGSRYEQAANRGIAHFAEHMFFKGTERRPTSRDLTTLIDGIGGEFNAFTSKEYTGYYVRCAGADRDTALDVLLDMLRHSKFDPEEIEREKGVILEEMNMYQDTPRDHIGTVYEHADVRRQPARLGGPRHEGDDQRGEPRDVPRVRRRVVHARAHGRRRQRHGRRRPGADARGAARRHVAERQPQAGARRARPPARARTSRSSTRTPSRRTSILGVPSYPIDHPDRYAIQLLSAVLGSGMSSRLFLEVRERRGLAYYVHGLNHSYTDAGSLLAQAGVDIKRIDEAVKVIVEQFDRMADGDGAVGRAREVPVDDEGPLRAADRGPAGADHVRASTARCSRARRSSPRST